MTLYTTFRSRKRKTGRLLIAILTLVNLVIYILSIHVRIHAQNLIYYIVFDICVKNCCVYFIFPSNTFCILPKISFTLLLFRKIVFIMSLKYNYIDDADLNDDPNDSDEIRTEPS